MNPPHNWTVAMSPHNWTVTSMPLVLRDDGLNSICPDGGCMTPNITVLTDGWNSLSEGAHAGIIIGAGAGAVLLLAAIAFLIFRCCRRRSDGKY